ncbi:hypothetical protein Syun_019536 [Stephania yunnanensis]|uniref:KH type-2 domain-containing protein n=1 Tax=Stephania yunnanensis TaxID=152371 RepID=A0AAP0IUC9_9MAGN
MELTLSLSPLSIPTNPRFTPTSPSPQTLIRVRNRDISLYKLSINGRRPESSTSSGKFAATSSDESSFLSLNEKPDRNLALLDEYEVEELDCEASPDPNHRSDMRKNSPSLWVSLQIILYDTPGVIQKKMHKLDSMMMKNVRNAAINADCVLVVVDACKVPEKVMLLVLSFRGTAISSLRTGLFQFQIDEVLEEGIANLEDEVPILLVLNKKDLIKPGEIAKRLEWYQKFTNVDDVIPVSAKYGHGVEDVKEWILSKLPFGPAYYPKDITSEHPERFFVAEIVREKIFIQYRNEVPYACQVNVVSYKTRPDAKDFIQVEIVVEKNSQKIILIGKEGKALKLLATAARLDIEDFLQKKVYLEVEVKVKENWRQDEGLLKHYGYGGQIRAY